MSGILTICCDWIDEAIRDEAMEEIRKLCEGKPRSDVFRLVGGNVISINDVTRDQARSLLAIVDSDLVATYQSKREEESDSGDRIPSRSLDDFPPDERAEIEEYIDSRPPQVDIYEDMSDEQYESLRGKMLALSGHDHSLITFADSLDELCSMMAQREEGNERWVAAPGPPLSGPNMTERRMLIARWKRWGIRD